MCLEQVLLIAAVVVLVLIVVFWKPKMREGMQPFPTVGGAVGYDVLPQQQPVFFPPDPLRVAEFSGPNSSDMGGMMPIPGSNGRSFNPYPGDEAMPAQQYSWTGIQEPVPGTYYEADTTYHE